MAFDPLVSMSPNRRRSISSLTEVPKNVEISRAAERCARVGVEKVSLCNHTTVIQDTLRRLHVEVGECCSLLRRNPLGTIGAHSDCFASSTSRYFVSMACYFNRQANFTVRFIFICSAGFCKAEASTSSAIRFCSGRGAERTPGKRRMHLFTFLLPLNTLDAYLLDHSREKPCLKYLRIHRETFGYATQVPTNAKDKRVVHLIRQTRRERPSDCDRRCSKKLM